MKLVKWLLLAALALSPSLGQAQTNSFFTDRAVGTSQFNGFTGLVPLPYAQVRVCDLPLTVASPCQNVSAVFDINGNPLSIVGGNFGQLTTDIVGRFSFQGAVGNHWIQVAATGSNTPQLSYPISIGSTSSIFNTLNRIQFINSSSDLGASVNAAVAALPSGGMVIVSSGSYNSATTLDCNTSNIRIQGYGVTLNYTGATNAAQITTQHCTIEGFNLVKSGAAGTTVGLSVAPGITVGHSTVAKVLDITAFDTGMLVQRTFYSGFEDIKSHGNITYNLRLTNTAISNSFFNFNSEGEAVTQICTRLDDTTTNVSSNKFFGGTAEGCLVQQIDIVGADHTAFYSPHIESAAPTTLGSVTFTNGSTAITSVGLFTSSMVGKSIKRDSDGTNKWMRIESVTNANAAVLSDQYQGTTGTSTSSTAPGLYRTTNGVGTGQRNILVDPEFAIGSGSTLAWYCQAGQDNQLITTDVEMLAMFGSSCAGSDIKATSTAVDTINLGGPTNHWTGGVGIVGGPAVSSREQVVSSGNSYIPLIVQAAAGQTVDLFDVINAAGSHCMFCVDVNGSVTIDGVAGGAASITVGTTSNLNFKLGSSGVGSVFFTDNMALGNSGNRWKGLFSTTGDFSTGLTVGGGIVNSGTGFKHIRSSTSCTTGAAIGANCTTAAINWVGTAFADTSYTLTCSLSGTLTNVPTVINTTKAAGSFTVTIAALTAAAATYGEVDCIGVHD